VIEPGGIALALAFARTAAFAAAMPLGRTRAVPNIVRAVVALCLAPVIAAARPADVAGLHDWISFASAMAGGALQGAAVGLCATIAAGSVAAAGALYDTALTSQPSISHDVFGDAGPVGSICTCAFGWIFFGGPFSRLVEVCAAADVRTISASAVAALASACVQTALSMAAPALAAQAFAAVSAAGIARMAPRVNGMFLGAPIAAVLVIAALVAGGGALIYALAGVAWHAAGAAGSLR
jgi:flagellar biosynthesis protein FliR